MPPAFSAAETDRCPWVPWSSTVALRSQAFQSRTEHFEVIYASKAAPFVAASRIAREEGLSIDVASGARVDRDERRRRNIRRAAAHQGEHARHRHVELLVLREEQPDEAAELRDETEIRDEEGEVAHREGAVPHRARADDRDGQQQSHDAQAAGHGAGGGGGARRGRRGRLRHDRVGRGAQAGADKSAAANSSLLDTQAASAPTIFIRIVLPLAKPAIAVTALFSFMWGWNEFILAATLIDKENMYTAPVGLGFFVGGFSQQWGYFAAGS